MQLKKLNISLMEEYLHELKAPISIIEGILLNNLGESRKTIVFDQIERARLQLNILEALMQNKTFKEFKNISLVSCIKMTLNMFQTKINANCNFLADHNIYSSHNDTLMIFVNLIKNSIEAHPDAYPTIDIRSWIEERTFCVSIADNGSGMSRSQAETLFANPQGVGTKAVARVVKEQSAKIYAESDSGAGTKITIKYQMGAVDFLPPVELVGLSSGDVNQYSKSVAVVR